MAIWVSERDGRARNGPPAAARRVCTWARTTGVPTRHGGMLHALRPRELGDTRARALSRSPAHVEAEAEAASRGDRHPAKSSFRHARRAPEPEPVTIRQCTADESHRAIGFTLHEQACWLLPAPDPALNLLYQSPATAPTARSALLLLTMLGDSQTLLHRPQSGRNAMRAMRHARMLVDDTMHGLLHRGRSRRGPPRRRSAMRRHSAR